MSIDLSKMPKLGFGLMRLPEKDGVIDHEQVCRMVDKYMEAGMNYFDTAYVYHGGKSEVAAREALVKRYPRESFMIADKLPDVFRTINTLRRYPDDWRSMNFYRGVAGRGGKASDCIGCGQCERVCPQHLPIIQLMKEAAEILDK